MTTRQPGDHGRHRAYASADRTDEATGVLLSALPGMVDATLRREARQDWVVTTERIAAGPALICFDGSDDAAAAIAMAGEMLAPRTGLVLTVWEPVASWAPSDRRRS